MRIEKYGYHEDGVQVWTFPFNPTPSWHVEDFFEILMNSLPPNYEVTEIYLQGDDNFRKHYILSSSRTKFVQFGDFRSGKNGEEGYFVTSFLTSIGEILGSHDITHVGLCCDITNQGTPNPAAIFYAIWKEPQNFKRYQTIWKMQISLYSDLFFFRDIAQEEYIKFNNVVKALKTRCTFVTEGESFSNYLEVEGMGLLTDGLEVPPLDEFDPHVQGFTKNKVERSSLVSGLTSTYQGVVLPEPESSVLKKIESVIGHPLRSVASIDWGWGFNAEKGHVTGLYLTSRNLDKFPVDFFEQLPNLERIRLTACHLKSIPPSLSQLPHLRDLCLNWNDLKKFLPELGDLTSLRYLFLKKNQLEELPPDFGALKALAFLDLESNSITKLPSNFTQLSHLIALDLTQNRLSDLPPDMDKLHALRYLNLEGNQLQTLPEELGRLPNLKTLNIANNNIQELPLSFISSHIQKLFWEGNPLNTKSLIVAKRMSG